MNAFVEGGIGRAECFDSFEKNVHIRLFQLFAKDKTKRKAAIVAATAMAKASYNVPTYRANSNTIRIVDFVIRDCESLDFSLKKKIETIKVKQLTLCFCKIQSRLDGIESSTCSLQAPSSMPNP